MLFLSYPLERTQWISKEGERRRRRIKLLLDISLLPLMMRQRNPLNNKMEGKENKRTAIDSFPHFSQLSRSSLSSIICFHTDQKKKMDLLSHETRPPNPFHFFPSLPKKQKRILSLKMKISYQKCTPLSLLFVSQHPTRNLSEPSFHALSIKDA